MAGRLFRWRAIVPLGLLLGLLALGWVLFADPIVESTAEEGATELLGTQVDIEALRIRETEGSVHLTGLAVADPFDPMRNLVEARGILLELDPLPLLEKKLVVRRLTIDGVRFGTTRAEAARTVAGGGLAPSALRAVREWRAGLPAPRQVLAPIDSVRAIALDPERLATVRAAGRLAERTDSLRAAFEASWQALAPDAPLDSAKAVAARLAGATPASLGLDGTRRAVSDVRRLLRDLDRIGNDLAGLERSLGAGLAALSEGVAAVDAGRQEDFAYARSLLRLPTLAAPEIGGALFGPVSLDRLQQAIYWADLAQQYLPPGLQPRRATGPERLRRRGETIRFPTRRELPPFLLQRGDLSFTLGAAGRESHYQVRVVDLTSAPTLLGRPTRIEALRDAARIGGASLGLSALLDHVGPVSRDSLRAVVSGVRLPGFPLPLLPLRAEPGVGSSSLDLAVRGHEISVRWNLRADRVRWAPDSVRARTLNPVEAMVTRVIAGVEALEITAEAVGPIRAPRVSIRSNVDRVVAARLQAVLGEEVARAEARVRAEVDALIRARVEPVRRQAGALEERARTRVAEARARVTEERRALEARLRSLGGALGGIPLPG